jgi:putative salt-induced outer membrane protein YdiY
MKHPSLLLLVLAAVCGGHRSADAQEPPGPAVLPPPAYLENWPQEIAPPVVGAPESIVPPPVELPAGDSVVEEIVGEAATEAVAPTPMWYELPYWLGPDPWDAGIEMGINGSSGNNDVFSMRVGGHAKRTTKYWKLDSSMVYNKNHTNGVETQNNGKHDLRLDRILAESPWTLFVLENLIYDEFQRYDLQLSLNTGVGYQWIKSEATDLLTRVGAGATREFGGVDDDWQPQALLGLDFTRQLTKMQRLAAKVDYYPEWEDFNQYRVVSDLSYQVDLDRPKNVSLKFSLIDRYDSTPDGAEPNSLDYAVLMIWKL